MKQIIQAEFLKIKRTAVIKVSIILPLICVGLSAILAAMNLSAAGYNWWNTIFQPLLVAFLCFTMQQYEQKATQYWPMQTSNISATKYWLAKSIVLASYLLIAQVICSGLLYALTIFFQRIGITQVQPVTISSSLLATILIWLTTVWQLPILLLLMKKANGIFMILVHFMLCFMQSIYVDTTKWLVLPFGWQTRMMMPVIGVMPNGLPVQDSSYLAINPQVLLASIGSIILVFISIYITSKMFTKDIQAK